MWAGRRRWLTLRRSAVLYERLLGRLTPVLPRFSATLIEPKIAEVMAKHEVSLEDVFAAKTAEALAQRLGARAMPIEGKRRLAAVGNAMDAELEALTEYLGGDGCEPGAVGDGFGEQDALPDEPAAADGGDVRGAEGGEPEEACRRDDAGAVSGRASAGAGGGGRVVCGDGAGKS